MKKNTARRKAASSPPPEDIDYAALRQRIRKRVGDEALNMVEATISAVNDGQYAALKYLFEAVGLFPAEIQDEGQRQDGLAPTLLRALGLPEASVLENAVTKDSAQS